MSTKTQDAERAAFEAQAVKVEPSVFLDRNERGYINPCTQSIFDGWMMCLAALDASAEPVVWRYFDGEGNYQYREDAPSDSSVYHASLYGRKFEPLFTRPIKNTLSDEQIKVVAERFYAYGTCEGDLIGFAHAIIAEMNK